MIIFPSAGRRIRKQYLTLNQYFKKAASVAPALLRQTPFVTISREAGAGGHSLAEALTKRFAKENDELFSNWQVFDRSLCERVAADPELNVSLKALIDEEFHTGLEDYLRSVLAAKSPQNKIDHHMFQTIRGVCALGAAVVIGRAAALITRDLPLGVHVRLVASRAARIERVRRETGLAEAAARKDLDQKDARRARIVETYFRKDIADPLLYDCVWNADTVSYDEMAEALIPLIRRRVARGLR